jgi:hypothetical protein
MADTDTNLSLDLESAFIRAMLRLSECHQILLDEYPRSDPRHPDTSGLTNDLAILSGVSVELRACPFCGKTDQLYVANVGVEHGDPEYAVECKRCWIRGPDDPNRVRAAYLWNTRPGNR